MQHIYDNDISQNAKGMEEIEAIETKEWKFDFPQSATNLIINTQTHTSTAFIKIIYRCNYR